MNDPTKILVETSLGDSWGGITWLVLTFGFFLGGALGYGRALRKILPLPRGSLLERLSDSFLLASALLWATAFLLAASNTLDVFPRGLYWAALFPGFLFFLPLAREAIGALRRRYRWAALVAFGVFFVRALTASLPAQHGDPLLYHLLGPRLWMEAGGFIMHPDLPNALLASTWECLYLWPQMLWFQVEPFYGLVEAQLFSQWLHLFLAWAGSGLLIMRLFRGTVRREWLPLLALAALFVTGLHWTAALAKNDVGIVFWTLGSLVYFREAGREKRAWMALLSGVFAGLAVSGKITAILSLAPILGMILLSFRPWRAARFFVYAAAVWLGGFLLGSIPIYLRNFRLSGDPFFPLFLSLFPSPWVSRTWQAHFSQVQPASPWHALPRLLSRLPDLMRETPWAVPAAILLGIVLGGRKRKGTHWLGSLRAESFPGLVFGAWAAYSIFVVTQMPEIELRYLGASLMILAAAGLALILTAAESLRAERWRRGAALLALAAVLATSRLPLHVVRKIWWSPLGVSFVKTHSAGEAKAWLRGQGSDGLTVMAGDNETYYLTPIHVTVLTERPDLDAAYAEKNFGPFVKKLCELTHARYLFDARPGIGIEARYPAGPIVSAKVFSAQGAKVYDLRKLESGFVGPLGPLYCH